MPFTTTLEFISGERESRSRWAGVSGFLEAFFGCEPRTKAMTWASVIRQNSRSLRPKSTVTSR